MIVIAGMLGMLSGCTKETPRMECDIAKSPYELIVTSPKDMKDKIHCFSNHCDSILGKEHCNPELYLKIDDDTDEDGLNDLAFTAENDSKPNGYCTGLYVLRSSSLSGESRRTYSEELGRYNETSDWDDQKRSLIEMYKSLPYPLILRKAWNCSY